MQFATIEQREREQALNAAWRLILDLVPDEDETTDAAVLLFRILDRIDNQRLNLCQHCGQIGGH